MSLNCTIFSHVVSHMAINIKGKCWLSRACAAEKQREPGAKRPAPASSVCVSSTKNLQLIGVAGFFDISKKFLPTVNFPRVSLLV